MVDVDDPIRLDQFAPIGLIHIQKIFGTQGKAIYSGQDFVPRLQAIAARSIDLYQTCICVTQRVVREQAGQAELRV
ncbi:hypothetical protein D9M70_570780 [compost metagenome]